MRTEEEQRAQLYQVATSHPDEATRSKARSLLDALPKHAADTRETDFVDQVDNGRAQLLDRTGAPRMAPAGIMREGQTVRRAPQNTNFGGGERAFVDQVDDGTASILDKKGHPRSIPAGDLKEGQSIEDPGEVNVIPSPIARGSRTAAAINGAVPNQIPYLVARYGNGLTGGLSDAIGDLVGTDSPANRARASEETKVGDIPLGPAAEFAGTLNPRGAVSAAANGLEGMAARVASRSPRVMALLGRAAAAPGARVAARAAEGAGLGGTLGAVQGAAGSRGDLGDMGEAALEGAKGGAATGAVLGAGAGIAGGVAKGLRSPDIALLEKHGMEPSPMPGRPVSDVGESVAGQAMSTLRRTPPSTGVAKATDATIEKAGIDSAKPIVNDLFARQRVNQARMGKLRAANEENFPEPSVSVGPQNDALQRLENAPGTSRSNRSRSRDLQQQVSKFSRPDPNRTVVTPNVSTPDLARAKVTELEATDPFGPQQTTAKLAPLTPQGPLPARVPIAKDPEYQGVVDNLAKRLATGKGTPQDQAAYESLTHPPKPAAPPAKPAAPMGIRPTDLQQIRDQVDSMAKQDARGATKVPKDANEMAQIAKGMQKALPREMQTQDTNFSKATGRIENAKRGLGLGAKPLHADDTELAVKAGHRIATAAKSSGAGVAAAERLTQLEPPAVMRSARKDAPEQIDYGALLARPRLQVAQQNLQADPGSLLTEGLPKAIPRGLRVFGQRLVYPAAKIAANAHLGPQSVGFDRLIRALRGRQEQDQE